MRVLLGMGWGRECQHARPPFNSQGTHRVVVGHVLDLLVVVSPSQLGQALRVEPPAVRKELGTVLLGKLCAEGVDGDDEGAAVCFKLWGRCTGEERGTGREAAASQLAGLPPGQGWGTSRWEGGQALTSRMGHMASAVVPPSRVHNL